MLRAKIKRGTDLVGEWDFYKGQISQMHPVCPTHQKKALVVKSDDIDLTGVVRAWNRPETVFAKTHLP